MSAPFHWYRAEEFNGKTSWFALCPQDSFALEGVYEGLLQDPTANSKILVLEDEMFEADVKELKIYPIYWNAKSTSLRRVVWSFFDGEKCTPLSPSFDGHVEREYNNNLAWIEDQEKRDSGLELCGNPLHGEFEGMFLVFQSGNLHSVFLGEVPTVGRMKKAFSSIWKSKKISLRIPHVRFVRGVVEFLKHSPEANSVFDFQRQEIPENLPEHLIFCIHGIGQRISATDDSASHVRSTATMHQRFKAQSHKKAHIHLIPVCWRLNLDLEVSLGSKTSTSKLEDMLDNAFVTNIALMRSLASNFVLDIVLYMHPQCGKTIINSLVSNLNSTYKAFVQNHPKFLAKGGTASFLAHSLGSVLAFDILSSFPEDKSAPRTAEMPALDFAVVNLFAIGSPIAPFLLLKGVERSYADQSEFVLKLRCKEFYNIFHPYDPVACRIEPLIDEKYKEISPEVIPYSKGGLTQMKLTINKGLNKAFSGIGLRDFAPSPVHEEVHTLPIHLNSRGRLDYALQTTVMQTSYISTLSSHTCYWEDDDLVAFILNAHTAHGNKSH